MTPKFLSVGSRKVAYYESSGTGKPVFLVHGNSSSGLAFQRQIEGAFGSRHHVVAVDLPGHGDSERFPKMEDYGLPAYATVIFAAAKALGMEEAVVVGWSLGGHIVLEAHGKFPRAKGFLIFGTPPLAFPPAMDQAFLPNPAVAVGFKEAVSEEEARAYATSFFSPGAKAPESPFVKDILRTDGRARSGLGASIRPDNLEDEVIVVANLAVPLAILHGGNEQLVSEPYISKLNMPTLWRKKVQIVAGAGHAIQWEQPEKFEALLEAFIADSTGR